MTMVTNLFPSGMNGLVICVLIAVLVGTIGSSLNALSTVFTTDVYVKNINPNATTQQQAGHYGLSSPALFSWLRVGYSHFAFALHIDDACDCPTGDRHPQSK